MLENSTSKFNNAAKLYREKNFEKAFYAYYELAANGSSSSQRFIGWMYFLGEGVAKDKEKSLYWFKKAAAVGDLEAQFGLGRLYSSIGDNQSAIYWYQKSSSEGFLPSTYHVAKMNLEGTIDNADKDKAMNLFGFAAKRGHIRSTKEYATLLINGNQGVLGKLKGAYVYIKLLITVIVLAFKEPNSDRFLY